VRVLDVQLIKLRVLIVGVRGLGIEAAKNVVLAGPAAVTIHDEDVVRAR
jgi:ubiquitin-activating enzyme E1